MAKKIYSANSDDVRVGMEDEEKETKKETKNKKTSSREFRTITVTFEPEELLVIKRWCVDRNLTISKFIRDSLKDVIKKQSY